jgi:hypothetical protein
MSTRTRLLAGTVALLLLGSSPAGADTTDTTTGAHAQRSGTSASSTHQRGVGEGWYLALVNRGERKRAGIKVHRQELQLIGPRGRRTTVLSEPASSRTAARLADWTPDGRTALLITQGMRRSVATRVDVATGATQTLPLPADVAEAGLAPDGDSLLTVGYEKRGKAPLAELGWDGATTPVSPDVDGPLLTSPDGDSVVTHGRAFGARRLRVLSLADGSVEESVPTTRPCSPVRWWDRHTVLATCYQHSGSTLSLVDLESSQVTPLTERVDPQPEDLGHLTARRLGRQVFVQVAGPCGYVYVGRRHPDGRITKLPLRHAIGNVLLVDTHGSQVTLQHAVSCDGAAPRSALTRYDPSTGRERTLVALSRRAAFDTVLPYGEVRATGF